MQSAAPQTALWGGRPRGRDSHPWTGNLETGTLTTRPPHLLDVLGHIANLLDRRGSGDREQEGQRLDLETAIVRILTRQIFYLA